MEGAKEGEAVRNPTVRTHTGLVDRNRIWLPQFNNGDSAYDHSAFIVQSSRRTADHTL